MANKMLIDATHPEETRVVVLRGNRVEEFDFEAANRKQLRGNIYLAKVTRVEPSLQAAFVDYGGNRHGFLAFSEIHPDYYQIPVADRQALLEEERLRRSSDDDFEPADDEADLQEIEDSDDDEIDDVAEEAREEDVKPRKARASRSRSSRKRTPRSTAKAAAEEAETPAESDASEDTEAVAKPDSEDDAQADGDAPQNTAPENSDSGSGADSDSDDQAGKIIPDRFLSAADDDDAVISGDVPSEGPEKPKTETKVEGESGSSADAVVENQSPVEADAAPDQAAEPETAGQPETGGEEGEDVCAGQDAPADAVEAASPESDTLETDGADTPEDGAGELEKATGADDSEGKVDGDQDGKSEPGEAENKDADGQSLDQEDGEEAAAKPAKRNQRNSEPAPSKPRRRYKIQEVIKRRQIILVQVVKEERGTKGAALTTYLSLAGRYSVLMPNSARGGGISRKITNPGDRKRLKQIANELPVPEGMGVILRTAGASRTKTEVKRDFEYLMRLWENVRDLTLQSTAPALVYEEGNLVKRSIRDLYNKDIDEVLVAGDTGYREAKDFMRMLMPSHAKNVQPYKDQVPIFARNRVEPQLDAMFLPQVTLPSGGYIVINQTEALVAVDVNSGKATREHNIEDTALRTNVEAAEEMARQLRLRDLAGLIVIDFIDMEEKRNNRTVERKLKDCLKSDRARIQVGRISHFGLLEMSRQRLRTGVLESSTELCPHCHGTGVIRSTESVALHVLRSIEDQLLRSSAHNLNVRIRTEVALYIINHKRYSLTDMEDRYGISLNLVADETIEDAYCIIDRAGIAESRRTPPAQSAEIVQPDTIDPDIDSAETSGDNSGEDADDEAPKKRRRKRRRRGRDAEGAARVERADGDQSDDQVEDDSENEAQAESDQESSEGREDAAGKKRRRGRRGGRRNKRSDTETDGAIADGTARAETAEPSEGADSEGAPGPADGDKAPEASVAPADAANDADQSTGAGNSAPDDAHEAVDANTENEEASSADAETDSETEPPVEAKPANEEAPSNGAAETDAANAETVHGDAENGAVATGADEPPGQGPVSETIVPETPPEPDRPKKSGWWQKRSFFK